MKNIFIVTIIISITGCFSTKVFPERDDRTPSYDIKKVSGKVYIIDYYGSPLSSVEDTREQWNYKADAICHRDYKYKNLKTGEVCNTNNFDCIEAHDLLNESGKKIQPFATGIALCAKSDEPEIIYSSFSNNNDSEEVKAVIVVKKLQEDVYFIEYAGTPDGTVEEGRKAWHERAAITCNGRAYDTKLSKDSMWQQDIRASGEGISLKHNVRSAGGSEVMRDIYCSGGGALDCVVASMMHSILSNRAKKKPEFEVKEDENVTYEDEVKYPVVEGRVFCK